jgi:hypothetical protein
MSAERWLEVCSLSYARVSHDFILRYSPRQAAAPWVIDGSWTSKHEYDTYTLSMVLAVELLHNVHHLSD